MDQAFAGDMYQLAKYLFLIGFADRKQGHDSYQQAQEQASDKEQQEQAAGSCQACQCIRGQPFGSGCCDEEPEKDGLQRVGYQYDGNHSQNGDEGNGLQCRMACEDQRTHTYHGGESGEEDGCLVRVQQLPSCAVLILQSVHNENAEIIPDSKIKVDRMMLMILNSIPSMPINPTMIIQLTNIGRKLIRVSSMRP